MALAKKAANWTAQQWAWLKANDPAKLKAGNQAMQKAGLKPKVTKAQVDAAGKKPASTKPKSTPQGTSQGFQKGVAYPNQGTKGSLGKALLGGGAVGAGTAFGLVGTNAGNLIPAAVGGPAGVGIAAGLLVAGKILNKKSNRDFVGVRDTGGAKAWKEKGGVLSKSKGKTPTMEEFTTKGRWLLPKDEYAHDYGRQFSQKDAKYYQGFVDHLNRAKSEAERNAILQAHGFEGQVAKKAEKKPSAPRPPEPPQAAAPPSPTADISDGERDFVSPPASGLEDTILTEPAQEPVDYRDPMDNAPGSGFGEYKPPRSFLTKSEEKEARQSFLTRAG